MDIDDDDSENRLLLRKDNSDHGASSHDEELADNNIGINYKVNIEKIIPSNSTRLESLNELLAEKYEDALSSTGFGLFSIFLLIFCGITLMADTTEILCVSFVMPSAERDLCLSDWEKGIIGSVIFLGMLIGGYTWGALADQIGRRTCLFFSITMNGVFGLASAFVEHSVSFAVLRFLSGVGVGASLPVVFSYYAEFLTKRMRGMLISWLSVFWMVGQITTSLFALAVIPRESSLQIGNYTIYSWRIFVCLCTIPAFLSSLLSLMMPESPRYLLVKGKKEKSLEVLKLMYRINLIGRKNRHNYPDAIMSLFSEDVDLFSEPKSYSFYRPLTLVKPVLHKFKQVFLATLYLFSKKLYFRSVFLLLIVFMMSFSTYGIILWFPEYVKSLLLSKTPPIVDNCLNATSVPRHSNAVCRNMILQNCIIDSSSFYTNWSFNNCSFNNVHFKNMEFDQLIMSNVSIENSKFENTSFNLFRLENSTLTDTSWLSVYLTNLTVLYLKSTKLDLEKSYITNGKIQFSALQRLNIYSSEISQISIIHTKLTEILYDSKSTFNDVKNENSTFEFAQNHNPNCPIRFNEDYDHNKLYLESLYFSLANLPGNLFTVLLIDFIPRKWILSVALLLSAGSVFTLWQIPNELVSVILLCIFNGVNVITWNVFNVLSVEIYPTVIRSTASGVLSAINRIGAIIGVNLFGAFIGISPAVPILTVALMLIVSSILSLGLPRLEKESLK